MSRGRGSWPWLTAVVVGFLATFVVVRQRSTFLALEAQGEFAAALAAAHGLGKATVLALGDGVGAAAGPASTERWQQAVAVFARERARCGEPLAALLATGDAAARAAVEDALAANAGAADAAWARVRVEAVALPALRFLELRARFAARAVARE